MNDFSSIRTFAASNSAQGFVSFFDDITSRYDTTVIKGGPGTGKSSLMKQVAKKATEIKMPVEYIYCSSDCDSLDGLLLDGCRRFICDGTPPHTVEPQFPGAKDEIINLGDCWDADRLVRNKDEILSLSRRASSNYPPAYAFLKAAGEAKSTRRALALPFLDRDKLGTYATGLIGRYIPYSEKNGVIRRRFLSAYSHKGFVTFKDTVYDAADRVYSFFDMYALGPILMKKLCDAALERGQTVYAFYDPLLPQEIAHVLLPEARLAFVTSNRALTFEAQKAPSVNLNRFVSKDAASVREKIFFAGRVERMCVKEALSYIAQAKKVHDDLEEYYISAMDFDKVRALGEKTAARMLKKCLPKTT